MWIDIDFKASGHDVTEVLSRQFLGVTPENRKTPEGLGVPALF
jgi:hypothetical protein